MSREIIVTEEFIQTLVTLGRYFREHDVTSVALRKRINASIDLNFAGFSLLDILIKFRSLFNDKTDLIENSPNSSIQGKELVLVLELKLGLMCVVYSHFALQLTKTKNYLQEGLKLLDDLLDPGNDPGRYIPAFRSRKRSSRLSKIEMPLTNISTDEPPRESSYNSSRPSFSGSNLFNITPPEPNHSNVTLGDLNVIDPLPPDSVVSVSTASDFLAPEVIPPDLMTSVSIPGNSELDEHFDANYQDCQAVFGDTFTVGPEEEAQVAPPPHESTRVSVPEMVFEPLIVRGIRALRRPPRKNVFDDPPYLTEDFMLECVQNRSNIVSDLLKYRGRIFRIVSGWQEANRLLNVPLEGTKFRGFNEEILHRRRLRRSRCNRIDQLIQDHHHQPSAVEASIANQDHDYDYYDDDDGAYGAHGAYDAYDDNNLQASEDEHWREAIEVNDQQPIEVNDQQPIEVNDQQPIEVNDQQPIEVNDQQPIEVNDQQPIEVSDQQSIVKSGPEMLHASVHQIIPPVEGALQEKYEESFAASWLGKDDSSAEPRLQHEFEDLDSFLQASCRSTVSRDLRARRQMALDVLSLIKRSSNKVYRQDKHRLRYTTVQEIKNLLPRQKLSYLMESLLLLNEFKTVYITQPVQQNGVIFIFPRNQHSS